MNAQFWVYYLDPAKPERGQQLLSVCSPDLVDPLKAHRRARDTAKKRLMKRGVNPVVLNSRCVG